MLLDLPTVQNEKKKVEKKQKVQTKEKNSAISAEYPPKIKYRARFLGQIFHFVFASRKVKLMA